MRRLPPLLALVLALALPSAALAQSAGDNQYADPFGSAPPSSQPKRQSSAPSGAGHSGPAPAAAPSAANGSGAVPAAAPATSATLPRTGLDALELVLAGAVAIAAGLALSLALRRLAARA